MTDKAKDHSPEPEEEYTLRERIGYRLDFIGQAIFPVGFGLVLGFYAADQGVRWMPTMMQLVLLGCILSLILMGAGWWLKGKMVTETKKGIKLRKRVVIGVVLSLIAFAAQLALSFSETPSALTNLDEESFNRAYRIDKGNLTEFDSGMENLLYDIERAGFLNEKSEKLISADEEVLLRDAWAALHRYSMALDQIRIFYEDYWRYDISRVERAYHLRSFLLTYAAELCLYEKAARFAALVDRNKNAAKFLDAPHATHGLPEGTFSQFKQQLLGARDQARVVAGEQYLKVLEKGFKARTEAEGLGAGPVWTQIRRHLRTIRALGTLSRTSLTLKADTQVLKRSVRRVWFPVQKGAAEWTGDTRVRRIGWYLIGKEVQEEIDAKIAPGDIMLSRKNWYLSNVGLPGFWPHAILYIGAPDKFQAYFEDPEVKAWIKAETGKDQTFGQYLQEKWPSRWGEFLHGDHGEPFRVIEAISEGVVFNTLNHAAGDYLSVMRPRVSKVAKAQAIAAAFGHLGKPYDFDFDFATDHALVCTELVWRAYRPREGIASGLDIPLVTVAGRRTLPANEYARIFAQQHDDPNRPLDFVVFVDALEKEQRVVISTQEEFRRTWERPQWDTAQR